jgi:pantetheine-phosphate adenylyltransferase
MKKIGVYAGSFNPFHVGHADILHQALEVFDEVILAIGNNPL